MDILVTGFRTYLHLPDPFPAYAVLGLVVADRMAFDGRPPWLLLNGGGGSGKTALLEALTLLPRVHEIDKIHEAGMISAVKAKDRADNATGGFLFQMGDRALMINMDLTTVLATDPRELKSALAVLRRVYDGRYSRQTGSDGGTAIKWEGRISFLAGVTPAIDRHYDMVNEMGDRYVQIRIPSTDGYRASHSVIDKLVGGDDRVLVQQELIADIIGGYEGANPSPYITRSASAKIVQCCTLAANARSSVPRDSYSRVIEGVSERESPTRMVSTLVQIYAGMRALELDEATSLAVCRRITLDSIPPLRRVALERIWLGTRAASIGGGGDDWVTRSKILDRSYGKPGRWHVAVEQVSTVTLDRMLQDLVFHGVLERKVLQPTGAVGYRFSKESEDLWRLGGLG